MPHDNRMMTSSTLNTHSVWKNVIKYDPYAADAGAPTGDGSGSRAAEKSEEDRRRDELLEQSRGLMELAKMQSEGQGLRGTCRRCNGVGHLTYECKNIISGASAAKTAAESDESDSDESSDDGGGGVPSAAPVAVAEARRSHARHEPRRRGSGSDSESSSQSGSSRSRRHRSHRRSHKHKSRHDSRDASHGRHRSHRNDDSSRDRKHHHHRHEREHRHRSDDGGRGQRDAGPNALSSSASGAADVTGDDGWCMRLEFLSRLMTAAAVRQTGVVYWKLLVLREARAGLCSFAARIRLELRVCHEMQPHCTVCSTKHEPRGISFYVHKVT